MGWGAYCCKGEEAPKKLEPRDPTFGNNQYSDFVGLLKEYMKDPKCAVDAESHGFDYFYDAPSKRSLDLRANDQCSAAGYSRLVVWMATLVANYATSRNQASLIAAWLVYLRYPTPMNLYLTIRNRNNYVATPISSNIEFMELVEFHESTEWDVSAFMQDLLMDPWEAAASMPGYLASRTIICEELEGAEKRGFLPLKPTKSLQERHIRPYCK